MNFLLAAETSWQDVALLVTFLAFMGFALWIDK